jgi:hypothetical protein
MILLANDFLLTTTGMINQERFSAEKRRNFTFQRGQVLTDSKRVLYNDSRSSLEAQL